MLPGLITVLRIAMVFTGQYHYNHSKQACCWWELIFTQKDKKGIARMALTILCLQVLAVWSLTLGCVPWQMGTLDVSVQTWRGLSWFLLTSSFVGCVWELSLLEVSCSKLFQISAVDLFILGKAWFGWFLWEVVFIKMACPVTVMSWCGSCPSFSSRMVATMGLGCQA